MQSADRIAKLRALLERSPDDPFLLYALAMERKKADPAGAIALFARVAQLDPRQCYAYFQMGQTHEQTGEIQAAKAAYRDGIAAAERCGDAHAKSELAAALELIE